MLISAVPDPHKERIVITVPSTLQSPQMHCRDFRIRLKLHELRRVSFSHLFTFRDLDVMADAAQHLHRACVAGSTDWSAEARGVGVSLEWDWIVLEDGTVALFKAAAPRTNLCLIGPDGYDLDEESQHAGLWAAVENIAWRSVVTSYLATSPSPGPC